MKRLLAFSLILTLCHGSRAQSLTVLNLRCEYRNNPLGLETTTPMLSWQIESTLKNTLQTAYRVVVSDDSVLLQKGVGNIWDSKKVNSSASIQVAYDGAMLNAAKRYFWKVRVWDNKGNSSAWSKIAAWQMGLFNPGDWGSAKWIAYDVINDTSVIAPHMHQGGKKAWGARKNILPLLRKDFLINGPVKQATVFISGLGHFEMEINGQKTGDHFLDPGWTDYSKKAQYVVFDITRQLLQGKNTIGVMLGNGFYYIPGQRYRKMTGAYGLPKLKARIVIQYTNGNIGYIDSDASWKTSPSPIIFSSIFGGEDYDANLEQAGWSSPGFNDGKWKNVLITGGPALVAQMAEPVKIMQEFAPVNEVKLNEASTILDLGQNFSGIVSIKVKGNAGDTVRIVPAELLNDDGTANQKATGGPYYFTYILKGGGEEEWQPRFSYYGFRYVQVNCIAKDSGHILPSVSSVRGLHIRNAAASVGRFSCSNELFNKTYKLIDWAIKSNMVSVFTDCPHREKLGWLEETHLMGASVQFNYDIAALATKVIKDIASAQYDDGKIPEIAPEFTKFTVPFDESPEWGSASIIFPWYIYQWYGDKRVLSDAYPVMKKYLTWLDSKDTNYILTHGLGDWYDNGPKRPGFSQLTTAGITATATWYYDLTIMIKIATLLGKTDDIHSYKSIAQKVRQAFNNRFFDPIKQRYDTVSQTANAMALYMGLVEPRHHAAVLKALVDDISSNNNALTAGDIGYRYVLRVLAEAGRNDIIYSMNNRDDVPGYGFQLKHGATALTESWQALPNVSNNHFMLGHLMEWFYNDLAGIQQAQGSIAYRDIEIRPQLVGDIDSVSASFESLYGKISSSWKREDNRFKLEVEIPVNTRARIYLPGEKQPIRVGSGYYKYTRSVKL